MTPDFNHQSTASNHHIEQGSERDFGESLASQRWRPDQPWAGVAYSRAALTMATMPALIASGSSGHASTTAARSGLSSRRGRYYANAGSATGSADSGQGRERSGWDMMTKSRDQALMLLLSRKFQGQTGPFGMIQSTGGGIRTHTLVPQERILSPQRLPFRHAGLVERTTPTAFWTLG